MCISVVKAVKNQFTLFTKGLLRAFRVFIALFCSHNTLRWTGYCIIALGVERGCYRLTAGFRDHKILSTLEYEPCWNTPPVSMQKEEELKKILTQPFYYIGHGGTCYCFSSHDQEYVLKFFKHQHLIETSILSKFALPSVLDTYRIQYLQKKNARIQHKRKEVLFASVLLAMERIPEQTGLIHIQLNRNNRIGQVVTLFDKIGVRHTIDVSQTEFIIQKKADMIFTVLQTLIETDQIDKAKQAIDSLIDYLEYRCRQGLADQDPHLAINFGYVKGKAVQIDVGSFSIDDSLQLPLNQKKEITQILQPLKSWLIRMNSNELNVYIDKKIETL